MTRRIDPERGSAMIEMAVTLPILVLIIQGIFYFGQGYVNKEKAEMAARFAAWEKIARPGDTDGRQDPQYNMVKDLITDRYFKNETVQLRFISDQEECRSAAHAAAAGGGGYEQQGGLGGVADTVGGILSGIGGLQCAEVKYTYNPTYPRNLFAAGEVKAVHGVLGDYYTRFEHADTGIFNLASFAWDKITSFFN